MYASLAQHAASSGQGDKSKLHRQILDLNLPFTPSTSSDSHCKPAPRIRRIGICIVEKPGSRHCIGASRSRWANIACARSWSVAVALPGGVHASMCRLRWGLGFQWSRRGLPLPGPILVTRLWILFRGLGGSLRGFGSCLRFLSLEFDAIQLDLGKVQRHGLLLPLITLLCLSKRVEKG